MAHQDSPWRNHRNAQPDSIVEKISMRLGKVGRERVIQENMDNNAYEEWVASMRSAPGGSTPRPPKRMSGPQRRAANRIIKEGKQSRGGKK